MRKAESHPVVLTEAMVSQKTRLALNAVKKLNMWGLNLTDVSIIAQMPNLEVLSLSVNHIQSLRPFASCINLTEVFLRANQISDFAEIQYLAGLPRLKVLWLSENPIASNPQYRARIVQMLPALEKLDETDVSDADRQSTGKPSDALPAAAPPDPPPRRAPPPRQPRENDRPLLTAVMALLPELSAESLRIVWNKIEELSQI
jgi:Leucine-rich repeat (LRR) protein